MSHMIGLLLAAQSSLRSDRRTFLLAPPTLGALAILANGAVFVVVCLALFCAVLFAKCGAI